MKQESSDNLLLTFAVIAVIVSILGAGVAYNSVSNFRNLITGFVVNTTTATVNVTISSNVLINFTTYNIDFGSGTPAQAETTELISTGDSNSPAGLDFDENSAGFVLENMGNENGSLWLKTDKTAATLLGGTGTFKYNVSEIEPGSCPKQNVTFGLWYDVNTTGDGTLICARFPSGDGMDTLRIDVNLTFPPTTTSGDKGAIFTAKIDDSNEE